MAEPIAAPARSWYQDRAHDPGFLLWTVAALCWVALLVPILVGAAGGHIHSLAGPAVAAPGALLIFFGSWLVMVGAMMLPTTVPLLRLFAVVSARQPRPARAMTAFLGGYLALWMAFALLALVAATGVQVLLPWAQVRPQWLFAGVLAIAGTFQFSPLKHRCLTQCRDPKAFLFTNYRRGVAGGWTLGLRHGLSCLGCCWALMLVMFGTGTGSLLVMSLLTAVMLAEKTTAWGRRITAPVGVVLLLLAAAVALPGSETPPAGASLPIHEHGSTHDSR